MSLAALLQFPNSAAAIASAFDLASESGLSPSQGSRPTVGAKILSLAKLSQDPVSSSGLPVERDDNWQLKQV